MKEVSVELNQFNSDLAYRKEYIMARPRHIRNIEMRCAWHDDLQSADWATFPISTEVVVVRKHESEQTITYSIEKVQNGKTTTICELNGYLDMLEDEDIDDFFEEFENHLEDFRKKGYKVLEP